MYVAGSVLLGAATALLVVTQAWLLATAITGVFQKESDLGDIAPVIAGLAGVAVLRMAVSWAQETTAYRASSSVKQQLRRRLLAHLEVLGPGWLRGRNSGEIAVLSTRGLDALDGYFARYLPQLVLACVVPVTVLLVVATEDLMSAVVIAVTVPLIPVFMVLIGWTTQRQQHRQWRTLELLSGHFLDVVAGLPTLKVFGRAKAQADSIRTVSEQYRRTTMTVLRVSFLSSLTLELLASLSVALVAVEIGIRLVDGSLSFFVGLFVLLLAPEAYLPLRLVGQHFHASQEGLAAAGRAFEVLETEVPPVGSHSAPDLARTTIRFDGVSVRYPDREVAAVGQATFAIRPGTTIALVGRSGCGKSTLVDVLLQFLAPSAGEITLDDGEHAVALSDVDPVSWRRQIAWLPQRPAFIAGSIADNVRIVDPHASDAQVLDALVSAGAGFVATLPAGIDTALGDEGSGLSVGQRQRVALARVVVSQASLVVLDEPTAGLDGESEQAVVDAIAGLGVDRTVVLVAHRRALVELADTVVVVESVAATV